MTKTNIAMPPAIPPTIAPTRVFALFAVVLFCTELPVRLCCVRNVVDVETDVVDDDTKTVSSSALEKKRERETLTRVNQD